MDHIGIHRIIFCFISLNQQSTIAEKFTENSQSKDVQKMSHKLSAKLDILKKCQISELLEMKKLFEKDVLSFCSSVQSLEKTLYKRNNTIEFEQRHVLYDTPCHLPWSALGFNYQVHFFEKNSHFKRAPRYARRGAQTQ